MTKGTFPKYRFRVFCRFGGGLQNSQTSPNALLIRQLGLETTASFEMLREKFYNSALGAKPLELHTTASVEIVLCLW